MTHRIDFFCGEEDEPLFLTLEPEGMLFQVRDGVEITFVASSDDPEFKWAFRYVKAYDSMLIYPTSSQYVPVEVYENSVLVYET
ncbi:hypothetical protein AAFN85_02495 [Mucilaginibacter sp. CAU 1740]|uniref:hypothetical protein n=1 Tax=Mucilaginibacter sp. CAU 1740 TaxID=3140365 RepID=UPI00325BFD7F